MSIIEGKIYKNQTALRYRLRTHQDISAIQTGYIKFKKPPDDDGVQVTGSWAAVRDTGATAAMGIVYVDFLGRGTAIDESGKWTFWSYVRFVGGGSAAGEGVDEMVYEEGE